MNVNVNLSQTFPKVADAICGAGARAVRGWFRAGFYYSCVAGTYYSHFAAQATLLPSYPYTSRSH